tara:strand:- start:261 stop:533 length:273 start_codon:yes stop_codon:yes gene_type:complete
MQIDPTTLFIIIAVIIVSLYWAWRKINQLIAKVDRLEGYLDTAYKKVENLEQDLLEKKVIDNYYKSKEELRKEELSKEVDREVEEMTKNG